MIKKERITDAALQLFAEKEYKSVRMEDLAEYLGISKKTLYNHFDSKEALLTAALERQVGENLSVLESIFEQKEKPFIPRLKEILRSANTALSFTDSYTRDSGIPKDLIDTIFPHLKDKILILIKKLVDEGIRDGYIRTDIPSEALPFLYLGIIETFLKMESRNGVHTSIRDMLKFIESIVFSGLLTEKGRSVLEDET